MVGNVKPIIPLYPALIEHQARLRHCTSCSLMTGPVIVGDPVLSPVMSIGQAPGNREGDFGYPFAWTAGKTLFKWFSQIGLDEKTYRQRVYMCAVCRCFPGKNPKGGDRMPNEAEITNCTQWLKAEIEILQPQLIILIGKLAIAQFLPLKKLEDVVGRCHRVTWQGHQFDVAPLPHPSGLSTWPRMEPGKTLLTQALQAIEAHPAWQSLLTEGISG